MATIEEKAPRLNSIRSLHRNAFQTVCDPIDSNEKRYSSVKVPNLRSSRSFH